jgi:DNA-binding CsgD family transcriptional regulator
MPRKRHDDAMVTRDLARFFDRMAAHFPGHVMQRVLEPDGRVHYTYVSPGLATLGLDPGAIVAQTASTQDWIHPDDAARWRAALRGSAESLETLDEEVRVIGADGRVRWVRSIGNPRRLASGAVVWDGIALDATDKREALEALKLAKADADAAEAAKSRALSGCASALEAPLAELRARARKDPGLAATVAKLEAAARLLVDRDAQAEMPPPSDDPRLAGLTERQRAVLALLGEGKSNREIGARLEISEGTAKLHVAAILKALGANRTEAALVVARR